MEVDLINLVAEVRDRDVVFEKKNHLSFFARFVAL